MLCTRSFAAAQDDKSGYVQDDKSGYVRDDKSGCVCGDIKDESMS